MIGQLILPVLITPTNYCFHNQVIPSPDRLDMVYSDFIQENMMPTKHGFSLNSGITKIWSHSNLPLLKGLQKEQKRKNGQKRTNGEKMTERNITRKN